jgi:DNA repair protein SbcC/Rad50
MLKSLELQNTQAHKKTKLEFHPNVNVIVGSSDSSKSTIIRAINWIRTNRPLGDDFRSWWGGDSFAEVKLDSGLVKREKGKSNRYILTEAENTLEFKAMGTSVPLEIIESLNLSDINVQSQLDPPFLLSLSSGEVAQVLNKLVNLDDIDISLASVASKLRKAKENVETTKTSLETKQNALESFDYLKTAEDTLNALKLLTEQMMSSQSILLSVSQSLVAIKGIKDAMAKNEAVVFHDLALTNLLNKVSTLKTIQTQSMGLRTLIGTILSSEASIVELEEVAKHEVSIDDLIGKIEKRNELFFEKLNLKNSIVCIISSEKEIDAAQKLQKGAEESFKELMPDMCPLCNQKIEKIVRRKK